MDHHELRPSSPPRRRSTSARPGREVNLSPSALGRTIRRLEEEVGERLFERDTRAVELTAAGRSLRSLRAGAARGVGSLPRLRSRAPARTSAASSRCTARWPPPTPCSPASSPSSARVTPACTCASRRATPRSRSSACRRGSRTWPWPPGPPSLARGLAFRTIAVSPLLFAAPIDRLRGGAPDRACADRLGEGAHDPDRGRAVAPAGGRVVPGPGRAGRASTPRCRDTRRWSPWCGWAAGWASSPAWCWTASPRRARRACSTWRRRSSRTWWACACTGAGSRRPLVTAFWDCAGAGSVLQDRDLHAAVLPGGLPRSHCRRSGRPRPCPGS